MLRFCSSARFFRSSAWTGWSSRKYSPDQELSCIPSRCRSVDLPAPEGPMTEMNSPSFTSRSMRRSTQTRVGPCSNDFSTPRSDITWYWDTKHYATGWKRSFRGDGAPCPPGDRSRTGRLGPDRETAPAKRLARGGARGDAPPVGDPLADELAQPAQAHRLVQERVHSQPGRRGGARGGAGEDHDGGVVPERADVGRDGQAFLPRFLLGQRDVRDHRRVRGR